MPDTGPILILTASAGSGHTTAALALARAFERQAPGMRVEVHDVLESASAIFRHVYSGGYDLIVDHVPRLFGWLYDVTDRAGARRSGGLRTALQELNLRRTRELILARRPSLIVNTHFLPAELVANLRHAGKLNCPQVTAVTDFETHRLWIQVPTERYYVAAETGALNLIAGGVDSSSIRRFGIPVRDAFDKTLDRQRTREKLGLDPVRPVVLFLCGGCTLATTTKLLRRLLTIRSSTQIVVVTGRNRRLHTRVLSHLDRCRRSVRTLAYVENMHEWMRAADLLVSKPGGLTAAEALTCGLPMVIVNPIPGQETRNCDYLLEHGVAIKVNSPRVLAGRIDALLAQPARIRELRHNALKLANPRAADRIAADALELIGAPLQPTAPPATRRSVQL